MATPYQSLRRHRTQPGVCAIGNNKDFKQPQFAQEHFGNRLGYLPQGSEGTAHPGQIYPGCNVSRTLLGMQAMWTTQNPRRDRSSLDR